MVMQTYVCVIKKEIKTVSVHRGQARWAPKPEWRFGEEENNDVTFIHSLVFSLRGRVGRDQGPVT